MRYLITGGAGFIGSHVADALIERGCDVVVLDDLSTGRLENIAHLEGSSLFRFVHGSVLDEFLVGQLVRESDAVAHLAAAVGVELVVREPLRSLTTNIRGSEVVLGAASREGRKVLLSSTSEVYGKNSSGPLKESSDGVLGPPTVSRWAYSISKTVDEILAFAYHKQHGLPVVVARLFNTVGARQSPAYGMVLPRFTQQAVRGEPLTVFGDGLQTRCFCHVSDTARALVQLLEEPRAEGEAFNVGGGEEISMRALADRVIAIAGSSSPLRFSSYDDAYEPGFEDMRRRVPDTTKIGSLIGWAPQVDLDDIIAEVVQEARMREVLRVS